MPELLQQQTNIIAATKGALFSYLYTNSSSSNTHYFGWFCGFCMRAQ
jgi:hypothetical protein